MMRKSGLWYKRKKIQDMRKNNHESNALVSYLQLQRIICGQNHHRNVRTSAKTVNRNYLRNTVKSILRT